MSFLKKMKENQIKTNTVWLRQNNSVDSLLHYFDKKFADSMNDKNLFCKFLGKYKNVAKNYMYECKVFCDFFMEDIKNWTNELNKNRAWCRNGLAVEIGYFRIA